MADTLTIKAPAKINLILRILGKRSDGFHELRSLMLTTGLCDQLRFESAPPGVLEIECNDPGVPVDETNLIHRAATALRNRLGHNLGCRVKLDKHIPTGGGMGGGSSDAASTLIALNQLWDGRLSTEELSEIGSGIGSDIPFFFSAPCAIVTGRGEQVVPADICWSGWVVLVMAGVHVSTKEVYSCCEPTGRENNNDGIAEALRATTADALSPGLYNGLEEAVFSVAPEVRQLRDKLIESGAPLIRVSGAGSVLFNLFDSKERAHEFASRVEQCGIAKNVMVVKAPA